MYKKTLLCVKSALKLVTFWCKSIVLSRIYYNFVTILGLKSFRHVWLVQDVLILRVISLREFQPYGR